ncbi:MAG: envelope stress response membrane protein PspB [Alphaproteobacteria bacterium]
MRPEILVFMIPIIAIIMGVGSSMLKSHYKHKENMMGHMSDDQIAELTQMSKIADILDQRVNVLERILDDEIPSWREKHDKTI